MTILAKKQYLYNISRKFKIALIPLKKACSEAWYQYYGFPSSFAKLTPSELISQRFTSVVKFVRSDLRLPTLELWVTWRVMLCNKDVVRFYVLAKDLTRRNLGVWRGEEELKDTEFDLVVEEVKKRIYKSRSLFLLKANYPIYRSHLSFVGMFPEANLTGRHLHHMIQDNPVMRLDSLDNNYFLDWSLTAGSFDHPYYLLPLTVEEHNNLHTLGISHVYTGK